MCKSHVCCRRLILSDDLKLQIRKLVNDARKTARPFALRNHILETVAVDDLFDILPLESLPNTDLAALPYSDEMTLS